MKACRHRKRHYNCWSYSGKNVGLFFWTWCTQFGAEDVHVDSTCSDEGTSALWTSSHLESRTATSEKCSGIHSNTTSRQHHITTTHELDTTTLHPEKSNPLYTFSYLQQSGLADLNQCDLNTCNWFKSWFKSIDFFIKKIKWFKSHWRFHLPMKNYNKQDEMYCFILPSIQLIQLIDDWF